MYKLPHSGRNIVEGIEFPRFKDPDDIGRALAARLREQVLLNSSQEETHTPVRTAPRSWVRTHRRLIALMQGRAA
jgi:hypothetical protein